MARTFVNEHDAIEYLLESEDAATRAAARVMGAKIDALDEALRDILHIFDRQLPNPSIGRRTCDKARAALAQTKE